MPYPTAWLVKHQRSEASAERLSAGRIDVDEAYPSGACSGSRGSGAGNKIPFFIAVQTNAQAPWPFSKLGPNPFARPVLAAWWEVSVNSDLSVTADELSGLRRINRHLKNGSASNFQKFDFPKYPQGYLTEAQYRFGLGPIGERLVSAMLDTSSFGKREIRLD